MKITTKYTRIERTIYEWTMDDIQRVLLKSEKLPEYQPGHRYTFEFDGEIACLTIIHETPEEQTPSPAGGLTP